MAFGENPQKGVQMSLLAMLSQNTTFSKVVKFMKQMVGQDGLVKTTMKGELDFLNLLSRSKRYTRRKVRWESCLLITSCHLHVA